VSRGLVPFILTALVLGGCAGGTAAHPVPAGDEPLPALRRTELGDLEADVATGPCRYAVWGRADAGWLKVDERLNPDGTLTGCDLMDPAVVAVVARGIRAHLNAASPKPENLSLHVGYLAGSPSFLLRWAEALKRSPEWGKRARPKAGTVTDYPLVRQLLFEKGVFASLDPVLRGLGLRLAGVDFEKVDFVAPEARPRVAAQLRKLGYSKRRPLPVPLRMALRLAALRK
jgi:hypothetical protein